MMLDGHYSRTHVVASLRILQMGEHRLGLFVANPQFSSDFYCKEGQISTLLKGTN